MSKIRTVLIKVLFFAQLADATGMRELQLELPDGATVAQALDRLGDTHEAVATMRDRIAIAVDEIYATNDTALTNECTLALIPPVSGG